MDARFFRSTALYRGLAICWTIGMLVAFSMPASSIPRVQAALGIDKLIHFGLFFGFGLLWMRALCPPSTATRPQQLRRYGLRLFGGGLGFAVASEVYQQLMPVRRFADPYDAVANSVGLAVGLLCYVVFVRWGTHEPVSSTDQRPS